MLKNLLQNQQNLKARGIYSCTGIYFFKSAPTAQQVNKPHNSDKEKPTTQEHFYSCVVGCFRFRLKASLKNNRFSENP